MTSSSSIVEGAVGYPVSLRHHIHISSSHLSLSPMSAGSVVVPFRGEEGVVLLRHDVLKIVARGV